MSTAAQQKKRTTRLKKKGLCIICKAPAVNRNHCEKHRRWVNKLNREHRARPKVCPHCGGELQKAS
jgi:uncharacterized protein with PIN domain